MDRGDVFMISLAFLFFPSVVAATFWSSGITQVIGVFMGMLVLDAVILTIAHFFQRKQD